MAYKDKEKEKEWFRKYRKVHKEKIAEYMRQYREANKGCLAERNRLYRNSPIGRAYNLLGAYRQEDKKNERGECTLEAQWIVDNIFSQPCYYCGETDWRVLGCDRIDNSKPHSPDNVVCSCKRCNEKRGTTPFAVFVQRLKDGESLLMKNRPDKSKPVRALDKDENIIMEFPSAREAGRNGYGTSHICKCCNGEQKTHKGLIWQWA